MNAARAYIEQQPLERRVALDQLRAAILSAVPDCHETIRRGVPAYTLDGRQLVSIGSARHHVSLYVMYGEVLAQLAGRLADLDVSRTVVRFPPTHPIPIDIVTEIVTLRAAEIRPPHADSTERVGDPRRPA